MRRPRTRLWRGTPQPALWSSPAGRARRGPGARSSAGPGGGAARIGRTTPPGRTSRRPRQPPRRGRGRLRRPPPSAQRLTSLGAGSRADDIAEHDVPQVGATPKGRTSQIGTPTALLRASNDACTRQADSPSSLKAVALQVMRGLIAAKRAFVLRHAGRPAAVRDLASVSAPTVRGGPAVGPVARQCRPVLRERIARCTTVRGASNPPLASQPGRLGADSRAERLDERPGDDALVHRTRESLRRAGRFAAAASSRSPGGRSPSCPESSTPSGRSARRRVVTGGR